MGQANEVGIGLNPVTAAGKSQPKIAPTGPAAFLPLTAAGIEAVIATLDHVAMEGDRFPQRQKRGGRSYAGPLEGGVRPMSTGILFTMAWGEPTTTQPDVTNAPSVYEHVWNPKAAGRRPMPGTIWTIQNDIYEETGDLADKVVDEYIGTYLNEFGWNVTGNDYLLFAGAVQAIRNLEDVVAPVATLDQTLNWSFDEVTCELSVPSIDTGNYLDFPVYDWGLSYSNNTTGADRFQMGSKEVPKIRPGNVDSTLSFTAADELETHYRRAIADFPELCGLRLSAVGRQLYEGTPDLFESLIAEFHGVEYTAGGRPMTAADTWEDVAVEARAVKSGADYFTVTLVNEHDGSAYAAPVSP